MEGSTEMSRSLTAALSAARTALVLVATVVGAYPADTIDFTQASRWDVRSDAIDTDPKGTVRRTRSIWTSVIGAHTCRSDHVR